MSKYLSSCRRQGLENSIKERLKKQGIKFFFPVQRQIIPRLLQTTADSFIRLALSFLDPEYFKLGGPGSGIVIISVPDSENPLFPGSYRPPGIPSSG
jgi:hypothetical protein